jgi:hypothetical protein
VAQGAGRVVEAPVVHPVPLTRAGSSFAPAPGRPRASARSTSSKRSASIGAYLLAAAPARGDVAAAAAPRRGTDPARTQATGQTIPRKVDLHGTAQQTGPKRVWQQSTVPEGQHSSPQHIVLPEGQHRPPHSKGQTQFPLPSQTRLREEWSHDVPFGRGTHWPAPSHKEQVKFTPSPQGKPSRSGTQSPNPSQTPQVPHFTPSEGMQVPLELHHRQEPQGVNMLSVTHCPVVESHVWQVWHVVTHWPLPSSHLSHGPQVLGEQVPVLGSHSSQGPHFGR